MADKTFSFYGPGDQKRLVDTLSDAPGLPKEAYRSEFRRDYARLVHSTSFRRLKGKMQMFPDTEGDYFRNRLTHSIEVAQIAKSITIRLNDSLKGDFPDAKIDTDLVELISLAHDLGHPPFGHEGEAQLDLCMLKHGGFEGNAQTLRLLSKIEKKERIDSEGPLVSDDVDNRAGLNLTYRALAGVLKYDNKITRSRADSSAIEKGYYDSEKGLVEKIKEEVSGSYTPTSGFKTVECQIMDFADDIAYSTYDLDDALKSGLVSILDMLSLPEESAQEIAKKASSSIGAPITAADVWAALVDILDSQKVFGLITDNPDFHHNNKNHVAFALGQITIGARELAGNAYLRNAFTSHLVGEFIRAVKIEPNADCLAFSKVTMDQDVWLKVEVLKHLAFQFLINTPRWKLAARRSREIVRYIFDAIIKDGGHVIMPKDFQSLYSHYQMNEAEKYRVVCDYIACMTDRYAIELYARLQSDRPTDFFKQH